MKIKALRKELKRIEKQYGEDLDVYFTNNRDEDELVQSIDVQMVWPLPEPQVVMW